MLLLLQCYYGCLRCCVCQNTNINVFVPQPTQGEDKKTNFGGKANKNTFSMNHFNPMEGFIAMSFQFICAFYNLITFNLDLDRKYFN